MKGEKPFDDAALSIQAVPFYDKSKEENGKQESEPGDMGWRSSFLRLYIMTASML